MRLTRALWVLLTLAVTTAVIATWVLTRPVAPEPPWAGAVSVLAGDGRDGWQDGSADDARFSEPFGLAAAPDGHIFVSDAGSSHRIRQVAANGTVATVAGGGRGFADGRGSEARFATPSGIARAPDGTLVVADSGNNAIRRVTASGIVTTVAGDGTAGYVDGPSAQARFNAPVGVAVDAAGRILVADTYNDRVRVIDLDGQVRTLAGGDDDNATADGRAGPPPARRSLGGGGSAANGDDGGRAGRRPARRSLGGGGDLGDGDDGVWRPTSAAGYRDGPAAEARFDTPCGVALAPDGRVLVADTGNGLIRAIGADGEVSTVLSPIVGYARPMALVAATTGDLYIVDERGAVVMVPPHGDARLLAGGSAGFADGVGSDARFRRPSGIALTLGPTPSSPRLIVADAGNAMVRLVLQNFAAAGVGLSKATRPAARVRQGGGSAWPWQTPLLIVPPRPRTVPSFDAEAFARTPLLWPVSPLDGPHEVAGTFGEARGEAGQERFHAGLDVRENQGTPVRAVRNGIVASPIATTAFETLNESLRIGPLTYVHIRAGRRARDARRNPGAGYRVPGTGNSDGESAGTRLRIGARVTSSERPNTAGAADAIGVPAASTTRPNSVGGGVGLVRHEPADVDLQRFAPVYDEGGVMIRMRAKRGAFFTTGDEVGTVNAFNHVHLNVGWSGEEYNPLRFRLVQFTDATPPSIAVAGVRLFDETWSPLNPDRLGPMRGRGRQRRATRLPPVEPVVVRGRVRIVVDAWDQADGNRAYRRLGLYAVGYTVTTVVPAQPPRPATVGPALRPRAEALAEAGARPSMASSDRTPNAERRTPPLEISPEGASNVEHRTWSAAPGVNGARAATPTIYAPGLTQVFERMRREADAAKRVYASGSGIPVYGASRTQFLYVATTAFHDGIATEGFWDTTTVAAGEHVLRVFVEDFNGNRTSRDLRVLVVP